MSRWRWLLPILLLALLVLPAIGQPGGESAEDVADVAESEVADPAPEILDPNIQIQVNEDLLGLIRAGQTFPIVVELTTLEKPINGMLEIHLPGEPMMQLPLSLAPPATHRQVFIGRQQPQAMNYNPMSGTSGSPPPGLTIILRAGNRVLVRRHVELSVNQGGVQWGELTSQIPLLQVAAGVLQVETPLNGMTPERLMEELTRERYDPSASNPASVPTASLPMSQDPPLVQGLPAGGFAIPGAYGGFDLLYLHGVDPRLWSAEHQATLQDWVLQGGVLLLHPGSAVDWNPWSLVGLTPEGRVPASERPVGSIAALGDFLSTPTPIPSLQTERYTLPASMRPLVLAEDGAPLLGWQPYGRGCIVACTIDLLHPELRGWPDLPAVLQWMADWGASHRLTTDQSPGLQAAMLLGQSGYSPYGYYRTPQPGPSAALALPVLGYATTYQASHGIRPAQYFLGAYLVLLIVTLPLLRSRSSWRPLTTLWGVAMLSSLIMSPIIQPQPIQWRAGSVRLGGPEMVRQQPTAIELYAHRGQYDSRFQLPDAVTAPRPIPGGIRLAPRVGEFGEGLTTAPNQYQLRLQSPSRLEALTLPIWMRMTLEDVKPPVAGTPGFTAQLVSIGEAPPAVQIDITDPTFKPNALYALAGQGRSLISCRVALKDVFVPSQTWPLELERQDRGSVDQPEAVDYDSQRYWWEHQTPAWSIASGNTVSTEQRKRLEWLNSYASAFTPWVTHLGGLVVVLARLPDPESGELPDIRIWLDSSASSVASSNPLVRLGWSHQVLLETVGSALQLRMEPGGILMWHTESPMADSVVLSLTLNDDPASVVLEAWRPASGWSMVAPLPITYEDRARFPVGTSGSAEAPTLYRIRALRPTQITNLQFTDLGYPALDSPE